MAYSAPVIHAVGDILTASDWNISSNDISFLAGTTSATVLTQETTTSASYTDLTTHGPAVTLTTGANCIVIISANLQNSGVAATYMSFAVSGATTNAANDEIASWYEAPTANFQGQFSSVWPLGVNAGSNTFTMKYKSGGNTATFENRNISVIPLP